MNLNKYFERGISKEAYIARLDKHRDAFTHIYENFSVPTEDITTLKKHDNIRVIALAEEWCGHCMMDIPILLRITEQANIPVRFLPRDENLDLMDQYLTNEKRVIPIFIFIDEAGNEISKWGPMAPEVQSFVDKGKASLPDRDDAAYEAAFQTFIKQISNDFRTDATIWQAVYNDILRTIIK